MGVEYTNRRGDVYYLEERKTRTGKTTYSFSRKPAGPLADAIPEGYEIYEDPGRAQVYLRKVRPSSVTPAERELLEECVRRLAGVAGFRVAVEGESLVVYTADGEDDVDRTISILAGPFLLESRRQAMREWMVNRANYSPMLRFRVAATPSRQFTAERWCFLGSIDTWVPLAGPAPLEVQARKYVGHLGKESFFNLM